MNHRDVRKASHVLPMALLVAGVLYRPGYGEAEAGRSLENPQAQVNRVLSALPALALPAAGRGTALVMWDTGADRPADQPRFVEFAFKGPMSRSDVFEFAAGKKGPWLYSRAITGRFHFGVNAAGARISYHPQHNQLGEDFHPAVFLSYPEAGEGPLDKKLRRYLEPEVDLAAVVNAEGILQLVHRWTYQYQDSFYGGTDHFSFDTRRGYLPVLIGNDSEYYEPPRESWHWTVKFEWVRCGSTWYVSSAERVSYTGEFPDAARPWYITITAFDPNAEVSDEEFTLEALGAQEGMTVVEAGTGFSHVYSPPVAALSEWKETMEETKPAPDAQEQDTPPAQPALDATNEQAPSETAAPARVPPTGASSTPAPARVSGGTPGAPEDLSHETLMDAHTGKQPGGSVPPAPRPAGKAHAAGTGPLSASPHRVVRIHTLVGLLLLLGMAGVVAGAHARTRARDR